MYSCLNGINSVVLLIYFSRVMVLLIGPYSCLLFKMCNAYADGGSLYLMYTWYLCLRLRLVCPLYGILRVLHVSL
jgi:hypothetical protein